MSYFALNFWTMFNDAWYGCFKRNAHVTETGFIAQTSTSAVAEFSEYKSLPFPLFFSLLPSPPPSHSLSLSFTYFYSTSSTISNILVASTIFSHTYLLHAITGRILLPVHIQSDNTRISSVSVSNLLHRNVKSRRETKVKGNICEQRLHSRTLLRKEVKYWKTERKEHNPRNNQRGLWCREDR